MGRSLVPQLCIMIICLQSASVILAQPPILGAGDKSALIEREARGKIQIFNAKLPPGNVFRYGVHADGVKDDSDLILAADALKIPLTFPKGVYRYTSNRNPEFSSVWTVDSSAVWNGVIPDILIQDPLSGTLVGLHQNHLQERATTRDKSITTGKILPPPLLGVEPAKSLTVVAHWYNDFGLNAARHGTGSMQWYDWSWNHVGTKDYDPARHPLLGWYRGDDPNVLGWQCYWLYKSGVQVVIPSEVFKLSEWMDSANHGFWIYQMFNNTPNFKVMKYIPWVAFKGDPQELSAHWTSMIQTLPKIAPNVFTLNVRNKKYLCVYVWDEGLLRGALDGYGGAFDRGAAFFEKHGMEARAGGWDGLMVMSRHAGFYSQLVAKANNKFEESMKRAGVSFVEMGYANMPSVKGATYQQLVDSFQIVDDHPQIAAVCTSMESKGNHPSRWTVTGSTPEKFESLMRKAARQIKDGGRLPVISIYNVSEWAEGGPGLQPQRRDGVGYLNAVKRVVDSF